MFRSKLKYDLCDNDTAGDCSETVRNKKNQQVFTDN